MDNVIIIPISEKYNDYAEEVLSKLKDKKLKASIDDRNETLNKRIRDNEIKGGSIIIVVGKKEKENNTISIRCTDISSIEDLINFKKNIK